MNSAFCNRSFSSSSTLRFSALASSSSETLESVFGKPVFVEDLFVLPRAGLDSPFVARNDGERPKPFALVTEEFCRFELGGRGELGRVLEGDVLGGWFLLLMLVMAEVLDNQQRPSRCCSVGMPKNWTDHTKQSDVGHQLDNEILQFSKFSVYGPYVVFEMRCCPLIQE